MTSYSFPIFGCLQSFKTSISVLTALISASSDDFLIRLIATFYFVIRLIPSNTSPYWPLLKSLPNL